MKNLKQLTAIVLCAVFSTMQISYASIDTGLGKQNGGAIIDSHSGGLKDVTTGMNTADLNFNANTHVKWNTLNIDKNQTMNFNAVDGAKNLTILNSVNNNMSKIYGDINTNGVSKLIISNPNGVLFDGAKFTTAGDVMVTTKDMSNVNVNNLTDGTWANSLKDVNTNDLIQVQVLNDSNFSVGGEFTIAAPKIVGNNSTINANNGLKLITANGSDYVLASERPKADKGVTFLKAMDINGNVEIVNGIGALSISDGTSIKGDLTTETKDIVHIFGKDENNKLDITGNVNIKSHNQESILRNAKIGGNLDMSNDGGFVEIGNTEVKGNANLTTTGWQPVNHQKQNHYVHVIGNTNIGGDLNIDSSQNIHIGNYRVTATEPYWQGDLLDGNLVVGGDINAKTSGGHIMTTINTTAKNVNYEANKYNDGTRNYGGNILSDDKAVITADTYKFKSDGYIGGMKAAKGYKIDDQIIDIMEKYTFIPADIESHEYMNINGGVISKLETPKTSAAGTDVQVYIKSKNDLLVNGANAGVINLVAPDKKITVTGDVHAKEINVGGRTGTLQLDFPNRDFTTNYTNIKDGVVKTIAPTDEITYELTNKPDVGYNSPDFQQTDGTNTTYLVGPGAPEPIPPEPTPPEPTPPGPNPPKPTDNGENARNLMTQWVPDDIMQAPVNTPVAFAADLDDDEILGPCRKNVDGSVTVVRAYPMAN